MMKKIKILIPLLGAVLLSSFIFTGSYGLSKRNLNIYNNAIKMQGEVNKLGFNDFKIKEYPVTFFNGENDYMLYNGNIKKRKPVVNTFVGTAYLVDNRYEVLIPTVEKFSKMLSVFSSAGNIISKDFGKGKEYDDTNHIATIWHEAFHAYQMTNYKKNIDSIANKEDLLKLKPLEDYIVSEVDNNSEVVKILKDELMLLKKAVNSKNDNDMKKYILKYKERSEQRKRLLSNDIRELENYYEVVEGTAFYVESNIFKMLSSEKEYFDYYIENIDKYSRGSGKYYKVGMVKCMLLNRLDSNWKEKLDFSEGLDKLLYKSLER